MPLPERRDPNLDTNGSTPFQTHQSLGQALGSHLGAPGPAYGRAADNYRNPSTSPPTLNQSGPPPQAHASSSAHSPLTFVTSGGQSSPGLKRKQIESSLGAQILKRRRDTDDPDGYDGDGNGQGAKHWTDEEKTKLFTWLMGPGQDDHWNALRATKNSCLRECAVEVFESKKTYQALKGCYERNFNVFKQIYAFETFHSHAGPVMQGLSEAERVKEYERRIAIAKKAGCEIGNLLPKTLDSWHRLGWYNLFYRRWHGDPATTRPVQARGAGAGPSNAAGDDPDEDNQPIDFGDPMMVNGLGGLNHDRNNHVAFLNPQALRDNPLPPSLSQSPPTGGNGPIPIPPLANGVDPGVANLSINANVVNILMQFVQMQSQASKMKLEYLRRRDDREEKESLQRREMQRLKMEREASEFEFKQQTEMHKQKTEKALQILSRSDIDANMKTMLTDYLRKFFSE